MTVTGGDSADEGTRVDRQPPSFPSVSPNTASTSPAGAPPPFSAAGDSHGTADVSAVETKSIDTGTQSSGGGRGGRLRWVVAAIATVVVLAIVGGVLFLAAPRPGTPSPLAHYVPTDTSMYAEVRYDLPGDQRQNLATFMSHFPGFADQASFQQKLDDSLNSLLSSKTNGKVDWNNDIKPWFGGQMAVFGNPSPASAPCMDVQLMTSGSCPTSDTVAQSVVALLVSDKTKLQATIDAKAGSAQVSSTDYRGFQIKTLAQPGGTSTSQSYVITDDAVLIAPTPDLLKQALDTKAGTGTSLADQKFFLDQLGQLHADRLATLYFDSSKQLAQMPMASAAGLPGQCTQLTSSVGGQRYVGELRAESDHLAFNVRAELPTGDNAPPTPTNRQTTLAQTMPSNTIAYAEMHNVGANLGWLIKNYMSCLTSMSGQPGALPSAAGLGDPSQMFEQLLGARPEDYLNFVQDAGIGITYDNNQISAGMVATVDDEATATARVAKIVSLLKLLGSGFGGASSGATITAADSDHNGTKVTTITVTPGANGSVPGATAQPVVVQIALANGRLYLGYGAFVTDALDRQASNSLASNAKYQHAIAGGPSDNSGIFFVDVAGALNVAEATMSQDAGASPTPDFNTNTKPFLDPLSTLSGVSHVDGGMVVINGFLYVE